MSKLGDDLVEAMGEMVAHLRGEPTKVVVHHVTVAPDVDVRAIREKTGLSRAKFAQRFALDPARPAGLGTGPPPPRPLAARHSDGHRPKPRGGDGGPVGFVRGGFQ